MGGGGWSPNGRPDRSRDLSGGASPEILPPGLPHILGTGPAVYGGLPFYVFLSVKNEKWNL